jgi:hypothetical protein
MKKYLFLLLFLVVAFSARAQSPGEQVARNKAEAASRGCLRDWGYPASLQLYSSATVSTICDYMNPNPHIFGYTVTVWGLSQCPPNMYCIQVIYPISIVEVSCSGQVVDVQCGVN